MRNANDYFGSQTGAENIYSCRPFPITYTDGVMDLVMNCKAYWLIDIIISYQNCKRINKHRFQIWELKRIQHDSFTILATDGNSHKIASQNIPFSDFPYDLVTIWLVDGTMLLPNEY